MDLKHHYQQYLESSGKKVLFNPPHKQDFNQSQKQDFVYVKYRGSVDLAHFVCYPLIKSSLVKNLCYDAKEKYVIVNLKGIYYLYCEVPSNVVLNWLSANSKGKFFDAHIKHNFACAE
ncbi:MAG: KTSC domain-containing protein [Gammaproteobacteria bacterium]|nr:KTSC domain-containing protein [Gammaproteobacteria bacterium]MBU1731860.1 KTSC domain-containing protein [Gammaproteobacteria bacterium]MBU1892471.1 KTSC domain-containing protein [Gammaproteobacteria bacterium]